MYVVTLLYKGRQQYLGPDLVFVNTVEGAETHNTFPDALQAIHDRADRAARFGWPTGDGILGIVVADEVKEIRVIRHCG